MKTLTSTISVIVVLSMFITSITPAQTASSGTAINAPTVPSVQASSIDESAPYSNSSPPTAETQFISTGDRLAFDFTDAFSTGSRSGGGRAVLVIPSGQTTTEELITINEDMSVMSRIFEKNLQQARISAAQSSLYGDLYNTGRYDALSNLLGGGKSGIQGMYLQGFGALFMMNVDFPLTPPPDMEQKEEEIQEAVEGDPVWQQVRQQMYEPQKAERKRSAGAARQQVKYDAAKVENLKTTLIKALKHAVNIRSLQPDETVILTIAGKGNSEGIQIISFKKISGEDQILLRQRTADGRVVNKMISGNSLENIELTSPTVLVIRSKKSDIDEFSKGDIDFEQFRQRVQLLRYPLLSGAGSSRNPLSTYYGYGKISTSPSSTNRSR